MSWACVVNDEDTHEDFGEENSSGVIPTHRTRSLAFRAMADAMTFGSTCTEVTPLKFSEPLAMIQSGGCIPGLIESGEFFAPCDAEPFDIPVHIEAYLKNRVQSARNPANCSRRGVTVPSEACAEASVEILKAMYSQHGLLPAKTVATKGGAIYAAYDNPSTGVTLRIEIDEDLDAIASVVDATGNVEAEAFEDEFADWAVSVLLGTISATSSPRYQKSPEIAMHAICR